ncbi:MAG TPA: hypothetical protein VFI95_02095 [Terriglobales bacterium]|nr:hypothetical protein [Terriglobales bacterium]
MFVSKGFKFVCPLRALALAAMISAAALPMMASSPPAPEIEQGFRLMYNLDFAHAEQEFSAFEREYPDNPMGPVSEAAGLLFSEFRRLGVLESQFYENDSAFAARKKLSADPEVRDRLTAALSRADNLAHARLAKYPQDHDALFALTLSSGLQADYAALVEKRNFASLHYAKQAAVTGNQLLSIHPDCYDAHLASGVSRYITGTMAAPVRWILRLGGVNADKQGGMQELQLTAERGQLLAPFARILLAIAYVREKDKSRALQELARLRNEFPSNPLFASEIARLDSNQRN